MTDIQNQFKSKNALEKFIIIVGVICTILSIFGPNPFLCIPAFITLYSIVHFLYRSRYYTALLFAFIYQWVQVSVKVLYGTLTFTSLQSLTVYPEKITTAYLLSCTGLILITFSIGMVLKKQRFNDSMIRTLVLRCNFRNILIAYFLIGLISGFLPRGLAEFAVQLAAFKWALFYLLFLLCYEQKRNKWILVALTLFEFILGFASFFASWKDVIFYVIICYLTVKKIDKKQIITGAIAGCIVVFFALVWTGVKTQYREYIAQGGKQVMAVSKSEAYMELLSLISEFQLNDEVVKAFLDRISYIDYFSACLDYVPSKQPHEYGKLTADAATHIVTPRILFPDKEMINESKHLTKYTGRWFSDLSMGVSFSLGYFGDFYVDFGAVGMMFALLLLGWIIGVGFRNLCRNAPNQLIAIMLLQVSFMLLYKFEISLLKLVGTFTVFWLLYRFLDMAFFPQFTSWILNKNAHTRIPQKTQGR